MGLSQHRIWVKLSLKLWELDENGRVPLGLSGAELQDFALFMRYHPGAVSGTTLGTRRVALHGVYGRALHYLISA